MFGDAKTRGLNLENTPPTDPAKIDTLTAILAIAMTWIYKTATVTRKTHGRRQKPWLRTGFDALQNPFLDDRILP